MQLREFHVLSTVKYFIGNEFCFLDWREENFKYDEEGKKTDVKDGIKVTIYSRRIVPKS